MREHWLEHAHGRIVAGDDELEVLADYGWVRITDAEREAAEFFSGFHNEGYGLIEKHAATLRNLLERLT
jgi:hypothetical protein